MAKILLVEDAPSIARGLVFNLEVEGYTVKHVTMAEEALLIYEKYDLIVLDLMLPGMSGYDFLRELRSHNFRLPVLILSAMSSDDAVVKGLELGADDYVIKPFSLAQLLLRIKRLILRSQWAPKAISSLKSYDINGYHIDFDNFLAIKQSSQEEVVLTQFEAGLLRYLIAHKNQVVSRDELLSAVWGYENPPSETRTVDIFMSRLRKIFEENARAPRHFLSIRGAGYKFAE